MFGDVDQLRQLLGEVIRVGTVTATDDEACSARVLFKDRNDVVSYNLPIMVQGSVNNKAYWMPDVDEQVICLFLPIGIETGFILGSFYSKKTLPPADTKNKRHIDFGDGTTIEYDKETHKLSININETTKIEADRENVLVNMNDATKIEADQNQLKLTAATGTVTMNDSGIDLEKGSSQIVLDGSGLVLKGATINMVKG